MRTHDVHLKPGNLHDGANHIAESSDGATLTAVVTGNAISAFRVTDRSGKTLHGTIEKAEASDAPEKLCKTTICVPVEGGRECWDVYVDCRIVGTIPKRGHL